MNLRVFGLFAMICTVTSIPTSGFGKEGGRLQAPREYRSLYLQGITKYRRSDLAGALASVKKAISRESVDEIPPGVMREMRVLEESLAACINLPPESQKGLSEAILVHVATAKQLLLGDYDGAVKSSDQARAMYAKLLGPNNWFSRRLALDAVQYKARVNVNADLLKQLHTIEIENARIYGTDTEEGVNAQNIRRMIYRALGEQTKALEAAKSAAEMAGRILSGEDLHIAMVGFVATHESAAGNHKEAEVNALHACRLVDQNTSTKNSQLSVETFSTFGQVLIAQEKYFEAERTLRIAIEITTLVPKGTINGRTLDTLCIQYVKCLRQLGRNREADEFARDNRIQE